MHGVYLHQAFPVYKHTVINVTYYLQVTFSVLRSVHDEVPIYKGCMAKRAIGSYSWMLFFSLPRIQYVWGHLPQQSVPQYQEMGDFMWALLKSKIDEGVDARKVGCLNNMSLSLRKFAKWRDVVPMAFRIWVEVMFLTSL